jgi:hypothetical protein
MQEKVRELSVVSTKKSSTIFSYLLVSAGITYSTLYVVAALAAVLYGLRVFYGDQIKIRRRSISDSVFFMFSFDNSN